MQRAFRALVERRLIGKRIWGRVQPIGLQWVRCPGGGGFLYEATPDDVLVRSFLWSNFRDWEPTTVPLFCDLARSSTGFLDVGAFTGVYSLLACAVNPDITVYAVEPNPSVMPKLRRNLEVNGLEGRSTAFSCALSDVAGTAVLNVPSDTTAASLNGSASGDRIGVELRTADEVLQGNGVDLVKIDVEGHEMEVLRGMRRTLESYGPSIFVECLGGDGFIEVRSYLAQIGYTRFTYIGPDGPCDFTDGIKAVPGFPNYICRMDG